MLSTVSSAEVTFANGWPVRVRRRSGVAGEKDCSASTHADDAGRGVTIGATVVGAVSVIARLGVLAQDASATKARPRARTGEIDSARTAEFRVSARRDGVAGGIVGARARPDEAPPDANDCRAA